VQVLVVKQRLGTVQHLVGRFFGHLRAEAPGPEDQQFVHDHLRDACAGVFWTQGPADQHHAVTVARRVELLLGDDEEAIEAALLHDVGKRTANTGAITRSIATVLDAARLPMTVRMRAYRDHGAHGAVALQEAGCGSLAVAFAREHPAGPPDGVDPVRWDVLLEADG
jgi:hypothetical protein